MLDILQHHFDLDYTWSCAGIDNKIFTNCFSRWNQFKNPKRKAEKKPESVNTALKYTLLKKEIIIKSILCFFDINRSTT